MYNAIKLASFLFFRAGGRCGGRTGGFSTSSAEQLETSPAYLRNAPKAGFLGLGQLPIAPALEQTIKRLASSLGTTPRALQPAKKSVFHLGSEPNKHSGIII